MKKLIEDIRTAGRVFGDIRKARREGFEPGEPQTTYRVPYVRFSHWGFTMESCLIYGNDTARSVIAAFNALPDELQHALTFTPEDEIPNGWVDRAKLWARFLRPALPSDQYHSVMLCLLQHYSKCKRQSTTEEHSEHESNRTAKSKAQGKAAASIVHNALMNMA